MKVITQLIRHFWQRGALTSEQAEYLLDQGFARLADLPGYQAPPEVAESAVATKTIELPSRLEEIGEQLDRPRKRGRGGPKGVVPEEKDLRMWLNKQFARRSRALASLVTFARQSAPCATWQDAVVRLRQVRPDRLQKGLASALRSHEIGLRTLWLAVDPEPFHARMEDASLRGPTVRAFRMLLALRSAPQMGRYVWILRLDEVQAALNLLAVHRRLLGALGELYRQHRPTLNAALQHSSHPVPQWAFVLLYNAGRRPWETARRTVTNTVRSNCRTKAPGSRPGQVRWSWTRAQLPNCSSAATAVGAPEIEPPATNRYTARWVGKYEGVSFPGSAWERTACTALPCEAELVMAKCAKDGSGDRASSALWSEAEPGTKYEHRRCY